MILLAAVVSYIDKSRKICYNTYTPNGMEVRV